MLGTIYDKWAKSNSVNIKEGDKFIIIRGKLLEVKLEYDTDLQISLVQMVDNTDEQHSQAISALMNSLEQHRKDIVIINQELKEITDKLDNEELQEDIEDALEGQARDRRARKRYHAKEIKKLEDQTTDSFTDRIVETGPTAVLPPGLTLHPPFLSDPICWCPYDMPESKVVEETITMVQEMPLNLTYTHHITPKGCGLKDFVPDEESKLVITDKDIHGEPSDDGDNKFVVESKED